MSIVKFLYIMTNVQCPRTNQHGFGANSNSQITLPLCLSEDDVNYFASKFRRTGFTGGLNYYQPMDLNWELTASWTGEKIKVPVKFIVGDLDLTYNTPGVKDFIHKGGFSKHVPFLQELDSWKALLIILTKRGLDKLVNISMISLRSFENTLLV